MDVAWSTAGLPCVSSNGLSLDEISFQIENYFSGIRAYIYLIACVILDLIAVLGVRTSFAYFNFPQYFLIPEKLILLCFMCTLSHHLPRVYSDKSVLKI